MSRKKVFWKDKNEKLWICDRHCIRMEMDKNVFKCSYASCESERPKTKKEIEDRIALIASIKRSKIESCSWVDCNNKRRENSIYCSVSCKNKNARHRYRLKQKGLLKE